MRAAGLAAILISVGDAVLLQLRRDYFTGGFLVENAATAVASRAAFACASLLLDLAAAAPLAFALGWLSCGWALPRTPRLVAMALTACLPFALVDAINYEIVRFLGDAFDLSLMFDLAGRQVGEVLAVSVGQAASFAAVLGAVALAAGCTLWWARRAAAWDGACVEPGPSAREWGVLGLVLVVGTAVGTVARASDPVLDNGLRRKPSGQMLGATAAVVTDLDRDGFGWGSVLVDPDPFDPNRHPYALDLPGNGIDENGLAGDLPIGPVYEEAVDSTPSFVRRPPVVLVSLESVRADSVGARLNGRAVTPVLEALTVEGLSHPRAYSHNGYTVQSRYHLLSGSLSEEQRGTLIDDFIANGYETAYFSGQDESFGIVNGRFDTGFARTAVHYDARQDRDRRASTFTTPGSLLVGSQVVIERLTAFLGRRDGSRPLMLVLGLGDTHFPYAHDALEPLLGVSPLPRRAIVPSAAVALRETYWQALANVDRAIGLALEAVQSRVGEPPVVIVVSDHGESLFDAGFLGHGYALDDVQTHIPLIVRGLDLELPDPFGQADLRVAVRQALGRRAAALGPRLVPRRDAGVFQYLGVIERARAIGLVSDSGRVVYDLRAGHLQIDATPAVPVPSANEAQRIAWTSVVHYWERLRLSQAAAADGRQRHTIE